MAYSDALPRGLPSPRRHTRLPRPSRPRGREVPATAIAVAIVGLAVVAMLVVRPAGESTARSVTRAGLVLAPLAAAGLCAFRARRENGRARAAWGLLAGSAGVWALGQVATAALEVVAGDPVGTPSLAESGYLASAPLALAGLLVLPGGTTGTGGRIRTLVDGLVIASALLLPAWAEVIRPVVSQATNPLAHAVGVAGPVADVLIATTVLLVVARSHPDRGVPVALAGAGLLALVAADAARRSFGGAATAGDLVDVARITGFLLVAAGAVGAPTAPRSAPHAASRRAALLPYPAVVLAVVSTTVEQGRAGTLEPFLAWDAVVMVALLVLRQVIALFDNLSLTRNLEANVAARTVEVEEKAASLRASEERTRMILETANDAFIGIDAGGMIIAWNNRAEETFGWSRREVLGRRLSETIVPEGQREAHEHGLRRHLASAGSAVLNRRLELTALQRDGREFPVELTVWSAPVGRTRTFNAFVRDISERRAFEDQLAHQALHDPLTGLPNRTLFHDRLTQALLRARRHAKPVAVLFCDLDAFKTVNDSLGHATGDALLQIVAARLADAMRQGDTVARLGGDEFAILLDGSDRIDETLVADRVIAAFHEPFVVQGREVFVRTSIGIATSESGHDEADEVLRNADAAMYHAKGTGGGRYEIFEDRMHTAMVERLELDADLRRALDGDELVLYYQPVVALATARVSGVEALVRWRHPRRGLVHPPGFIPAAEDTGLIVPIGRWILQRACAQVRSWGETGPADTSLTVTVNLSARQLQDPGLVDDVAGALAAAGLEPHRLVLEITESVLMEDTEQTIMRLGELKALGIRLAIDDFGTGYSSLSYLNRLPVDVLKIDQSFVSNVPDDTEATALVRAIVDLGRTFGLITVAEGVERREQLDELRVMGCRFAQGFYLGEPLDEDSIAALLGQAVVIPAVAVAP